MCSPLIYCVAHENSILYPKALQENYQYKNEYRVLISYNRHYLVENLKKHNLAPEK